MQWSSFRGQDESETLATLPLSLRRDVIDHLLGDILRGSVYFENISRGCLNSLIWGVDIVDVVGVYGVDIVGVTLRSELFDYL